MSRINKLKQIRDLVTELLADEDTKLPIFSDLQGRWQTIWDSILLKQIKVPKAPKLSVKTEAALKKYGFMPMYLPDLKETDYPAKFILPNWGKWLTMNDIEKKPLVGQWIAVETIKKPHWNDDNKEDTLRDELGLDTRFRQTWDATTETHLPKVAKILGVSNKATRLPSAEEWNLIGNVFNWLRDELNEDLPDLGATNSWEWCENAYESGRRLLVGSAEYGGLAGVHYHWHGRSDDGVAFRVLAVLGT